MDAEQELNRLADPGLVDDLEARSVEQLRALRDACRSLEPRVSYRRRILQGRIDIALAERDRRGADEDLVEWLSHVLADRPSGAPRSDRALSVEDFSGDDDPEDAGLPGMLDLPDLDEDALAELISSLQARERSLSERRRGLLDNLDRLQAELVDRYRRGHAEVAQVVPDAGG